MIKTLSLRTWVSLVLAMAIGLSVALFSFAPSVRADGVGTGMQEFATYLGYETVGELISEEIYGNTSNETESGNGVVPSWSPGPWVCGVPSDCEGPTNPGSSMGDIITTVALDGVGSSNFTNEVDPDIDFSLH